MNAKYLVFLTGVVLILLAVLEGLFNFSFVNFREALSFSITGNIALAMFYLIKGDKNLLGQFLFLGILIFTSIAFL